MKTILSNMLFVLVFISFQACGQKKMETNKMENLPKTEAEWKAKLSEEEYYILRQKGTESPYTGKFLMHNEKGVYTCKGCGAPLFSSNSKFDSHCGWPSFYAPLAEDRVRYIEDRTMFMKRVEVRCGTCDSHLGHVFDDGYGTPTGQRYCINSISMTLEPDPT